VFGYICERVLRELDDEARGSMSIREFIVSHGKVGPGRIMPVKKDRQSEERFSRGSSVGGAEERREGEIWCRLGQFIVFANLRRARVCWVLSFR